MTTTQQAKDYITDVISGEVAGEIPKFAVITGGTTGIGPSIAVLLARIGCRRIIVVGRNVVAGEEVVSRMRIESQSGDFSLIRGDLS